MSSPSELRNLVAEIVRTYPTAQLEFDPLPSGVCFLWTTLGARNFVIEYDPERGAGVSDNLADTPAFVGHDHAFTSLGDGISKFRELLRSAAEFDVPFPLLLSCCHHFHKMKSVEISQRQMVTD